MAACIGIFHANVVVNVYFTASVGQLPSVASKHIVDSPLYLKEQTVHDFPFYHVPNHGY